ncbi:MAG: flagellar hook-basal body complex protein [Rhodobacteraceae bacterium]|nr:flagellar hook-basal body complex protein [Paracoccaceae bacterium]
METAGYATLSRQSGLMREMRVVANNIANSATTGFRQEGLVFAEYVQKVDDGSSVSMADARARGTSMLQGALTQTGGSFDLAINGPGFFLVLTPGGERLTRAGNFSPNAAGDLVTADGFQVLDAGGAPVFVPANAGALMVAADGSISVEGQPIGQIGLFTPVDPVTLRREDGVMFSAEGGFDPVPDPQILQGFLEGSNVDAVSQLARMIEIQRGYEMGQSFLETEDQRIREAVKTLIR